MSFTDLTISPSFETSQKPNETGRIPDPSDQPGKVMTLASSNSATQGLQSDTGAPKGGQSRTEWMDLADFLRHFAKCHRDLLLEICRFCIVLVFRLNLAGDF